MMMMFVMLGLLQEYFCSWHNILKLILECDDVSW